MNILLHICCGPCALIPTARLREQRHKKKLERLAATAETTPGVHRKA